MEGNCQDSKAYLSRQVNGNKDDSVAMATTSATYVEHKMVEAILRIVILWSLICDTHINLSPCGRRAGTGLSLCRKGGIVSLYEYALRDRRCGAFKDIENQSLYAI